MGTLRTAQCTPPARLACGWLAPPGDVVLVVRVAGLTLLCLVAGVTFRWIFRARVLEALGWIGFAVLELSPHLLLGGAKQMYQSAVSAAWVPRRRVVLARRVCEHLASAERAIAGVMQQEMSSEKEWAPAQASACTRAMVDCQGRSGVAAAACLALPPVRAQWWVATSHAWEGCVRLLRLDGGWTPLVWLGMLCAAWFWRWRRRRSGAAGAAAAGRGRGPKQRALLDV